MLAFLEPLEELADYQEIVRKRGKAEGILQIAGCVSSQKTHLMYALGDGFEYRVIVFSSEEKAKQAYEEYKMLEENTFLYPAKDLLFYHADIKGAALTGKRMEVLKKLTEKKNREPVTVITTADAFLDGLPSKEKLWESRIEIEAGAVIDFQKLQEELVHLGYERESQIEGPGQFAVRGGILDVYPLTEEIPVRIELWGDEIDSIRSFDVESQRSVENMEQVVIYPATENVEKEEQAVSFAEYFPKEKSLFFFDEPVRLQETLEAVEKEYFHSFESRKNAGMTEEADEIRVFQTKEIIEKFNTRYGIGLTTLETRCGGFKVRDVYSIQAAGVNPYNNSFEMLTQDLKKLKRQGYRVILVSGSRTRAKRLAEDLRDYDLSSFYSEDMVRTVRPGEIMVVYGCVAEGYEYPMLKFMVISESDIFGKRKKKRRRKVYEGQKIQEFAELKPGDYVVHENHGLGVYQGIEKVEVDKVTRDYMKISYADGGILYILATQMDLIQKYAGADAKPPKLNKLGTPQWNKTKSQVKKAVQVIAQDLVELYAVRQQTEGFVYSPDTVWQKEFEEMFPFEETEDQLRAIEDTKKDMESTKVMDRLICGDVGYGKTEVAIRAAFKAVQDGKQVVYLVPTTILAQQHYNTFKERMKEFPVEIRLLCRFCTPKEVRETIADLKAGKVDIVIGTHRLLSKDVAFKQLGLLIIDEEQRFGVTHKEKIKQMKTNVDVLTLTATPIPRTLHMSLIGIRDMSVLEEAPVDRRAIQTYVMELDPELVKEAIKRELARDGQVYYVYNRVNNIEMITSEIASLVPDAVVEYAHGQMHERQLEDIMYRFINHEIDVLVTTTIIETGLDIPNANTMIIHDADTFGLSQLYQLRGRVGRSDRNAYAFLMYRRDKLIKETAEKRLKAIREFTDLGSGIKVSMKDLEIRGAGNILGEDQSGHMEAVGYDLYCKMLNDAIRQEMGEKVEERFETTVQLPVDAYIPAEYVKNEFIKLDLYKRISHIASDDDYDDIIDELNDRFGEMPTEVLNLLDVSLLKAKANRAYITSIMLAGAELRFSMFKQAKIDTAKIDSLLDKYRGSMKFVIGNSPSFVLKMKTITEKEIWKQARAVVVDIAELAEE